MTAPFAKAPMKALAETGATTTANSQTTIANREFLKELRDAYLVHPEDWETVSEPMREYAGAGPGCRPKNSQGASTRQLGAG
jgi:hypothetical protein